MPKIQHVHFQVLSDGRVFQGFPSKHGCEGCIAETESELTCMEIRCMPFQTNRRCHLTFKDTGKRVRKGLETTTHDIAGYDAIS